jgi:hypothetical protein
MLNCSGVRMACHSSSDFLTGTGGGVDDDIAATPGNRRPAAWPRHGCAAHERGADRGRAAAGEGARRKEESGKADRGATAAGHGCDAILSLSRRCTPMSRDASVTCRVRCLIRLVFWTSLLGMVASGAGSGCPPRVRTSRMICCGPTRPLRVVRQPA